MRRGKLEPRSSWFWRLGLLEQSPGPVPYLLWEHRVRGVHLLPWMSCPHRGLASGTQKAVALGAGVGPQPGGAGRVGMFRPGLTVQGAAAQRGPQNFDVQPRGRAGIHPCRQPSLRLREHRGRRGTGASDAEPEEASPRRGRGGPAKGQEAGQGLQAQEGQTLAGADFAHLTGCH